MVIFVCSKIRTPSVHKNKVNCFYFQLFVSKITGSEVNKLVDAVWHQWCTRCLRVSVWTEIRRIFQIPEWTAESFLDEKLLVFMGNLLLLSILKAVVNFHFALAVK